MARAAFLLVLKTSLDNKSVLDIGCATGDFLYYLSTCFPKADLFGADVDLELLERMKREVPSVKKSFQIDISNLSTDIGQYDVVFMSGVHSIFDDLNCLLSVKSLLKNSSSIAYIFGIWNPEDIDVIIKSKKSNTNGSFEKGWNVFSKSTVNNFAKINGLKTSFNDFNLEVDIVKNEDDPLRSWTIDTIQGGKLVINGLCLILHFSLLELRINET